MKKPTRDMKSSRWDYEIKIKTNITKMIKSKSTYYFTYNLDNNFDTIIEIYVWSGDIAVRPLNPVYTITDTNPALDATNTINPSSLINDFLEFTPVSGTSTGLVNMPNTVNVSIDRTVNGVTTNELQTTAIKGHYSAIEGVNIGLPTNKILVQGDYMKINKTSTAIIPLNPDGTNVTIVSLPYNNINLNLPVATSDDTAEKFKSVWINASEAGADNLIEITYNSETYLIEIFDECKHEPVDIHFINKEGQQQSFTFFKERKDTTELSKETYQRFGADASIGEHQYIDYNLNSRSKFSINSGFVEESQNAVFKEMIQSERLWQYKDSKFIPLNLESKQLQYQTRVNDRLIKYTLNFSFSYDDIYTI